MSLNKAEWFKSDDALGLDRIISDRETFVRLAYELRNKNSTKRKGFSNELAKILCRLYVEDNV